MRVCSRLGCALSHLLHMLDCVGYNMLLFGLINPYVFEDLALQPHVRVLLYGYIYQGYNHHMDREIYLHQLTQFIAL